MAKYNKHKDDSQVILQEFFELAQGFSEYSHFFKDGSGTSYASFSVIGPSTSVRIRINEKASSLAAELYVLQLAVNFILKHGPPRSILFF